MFTPCIWSAARDHMHLGHYIVLKVKVGYLYSAAYTWTRAQKRFTILEVAADWHELMITYKWVELRILSQLLRIFDLTVILQRRNNLTFWSTTPVPRGFLRGKRSTALKAFLLQITSVRRNVFQLIVSVAVSVSVVVKAGENVTLLITTTRRR